MFLRASVACLSDLWLLCNSLVDLLEELFLEDRPEIRKGPLRRAARGVRRLSG